MEAVMPKDYSDVSGIMQGAQMAMQAYGIKNERDMQKYNQQMQDRQMALQEKQDMREMNAAEMAAKITGLKYDQEKAETEKYNRTKDMMITEETIKRAALEDAQKSMIRNKVSADTFRKTGGMPGTEFDYLNEPYAMAQEAGDYNAMIKLAEKLTGNFTPKGFDPVTGKPVGTDAAGNLVSGGQPYTGGPFKPLTENSTTKEGQWGTLTSEDKKPFIEEYILTGKTPQEYYRDATSKTLFKKDFSDYLKEKDLDAPKVGRIRNQYKGLAQSLAQQEKTYGAMVPYVENLNEQINRVKELYNEGIQRVGIKAIDMPVRELRKKVIGSGLESSLDLFMTEISNEAARLSAGSALSIRELSEGAQKKWSKIHDESLSLKEMQKILNETRKVGDYRINSTMNGIVKTQARLDNLLGDENTSNPVSIKYNINGKIYNIPSNEKDEFLKDNPNARMVQ
jgi:hypothetical protein